jgi:pyridoxal phosphate enzyme (YggS family)
LNHIEQHIASIRATIPNGVTLICVSKFHPIESIQAAYDCGERDFGESRVQELLLKQQALPADIRWHFIGHLQTNKVKQIVPFVHMIHSVDSVRLLEVINREAEKIGRRVKVLLEVHVAKEDTKSGFMPEEITSLNTKLSTLNYIEICGIMGMATNTDDQTEWRRCFREIKSIGQQLLNHSELLNNSAPQISMGMSDDYLVAIEEGSTMVRIGSSIFGERQY